MFILNLKSINCAGGVEVVGCDESILKELTHQLFPHIISVDGIPKYYIICEKSDTNDYKFANNHLYINYKDDSYLKKILRRGVRDSLYNQYLEDGYVKFHASVVEKDDNYILFAGDKRKGKTSTALGLARFCGYSFVTGDLALVKNNNILGWATPVGIREITREILDIPEGYNTNNEMSWYYPIDMMEKYGFIYSFGGKIKLIIASNYNFDCKSITSYELNKNDRKEILLNNIHYDEFNKGNFWNAPSIDLEKCKKEILNVNSKMIYLESNGLSESNAKKIDLIIRRNI